MPLTVDEVKVGDQVQYDRPSPPVTVQIDTIDHNVEIVWVTMLDGELAGAQGPIFLGNCSKFVIRELG